MVGDIDTNEVEGVTVVSLRGEIDLSVAPALQSRLHRAIDRAGGHAVVVDLDGASSLDANGVGVLVAALGRAVSRGGDLLLVVTPGPLDDQLTLCRLDRVFERFPTRAAAIAAARS